MLLPVVRGALPPDDPRSRATIRVVQEELAEDGFVYRFRHDGRPLHAAEGAFLLCGFWMAQVAHACGDAVAAARWYGRGRAACGPAGLYTVGGVQEHVGNLREPVSEPLVDAVGDVLSPPGPRRPV